MGEHTGTRATWVLAIALVVAMMVGAVVVVFYASQGDKLGTQPTTVAALPPQQQQQQVGGNSISAVVPVVGGSRAQSVVAGAGAITSNVTLIVKRYAASNARTLSLAGPAALVAADFVRLPARAVAAADLPDFFDGLTDAQSLDCTVKSGSGSETQYACSFILFPDGSAAIGQLTFGVDPTVSLAPFDASLIGSVVQRVTLSAPYIATSTVPAAAAAAASNVTAAAAFVARWNVGHPRP